MSNAIATLCWVRGHLHSLAVHPGDSEIFVD